MSAKFLTPVLTAAILFAAAPAFAVNSISKVEVTADLEAIRNANAAPHWASLVPDLETAIVQRITDRIDKRGARILIDIDEIALANSFRAPLSANDSKLVGDVRVRGAEEDPKRARYSLTVSYDQATPYMAPGTQIRAITSDSREYYDSMIDAFAERVVANLE